MRVVSGKFRGLKLREPIDEEIRPTLDRVKTSVFDTLGPNLKSAKVLDLFCGSGALGIEALSRGASSCFFCDKSAKSIELTKYNLAICDKKNECEKVFINSPFEAALSSLSQRGLQFDLILLDPPYDLETAFDAVKMVLDLKLCSKDGIIVFETDRKEMVLKVENLGLKTRTLAYGSKRVYLIFC